MPRKPKSICRQPGCGALVDLPGFCVKHAVAKQKADTERRGTAHERGYTSAWTRARAHYLRAYPLCVHCEQVGIITAATVVDHIVPHRLKDAIDSGDQSLIARAKALFWDSVRNWQSLCKRHHDTKTATEDGGFGRKAWNRKRWSGNVGSLDVIGRGRLCAICRSGDHHEEHCDDTPEALHERTAPAGQVDDSDAATDLS